MANNFALIDEIFCRVSTCTRKDQLAAKRAHKKTKSTARNYLSDAQALQDISSTTQKTRISQGFGAIFSTR
jgi:hypothetical protein